MGYMLSNDISTLIQGFGWTPGRRVSVKGFRVGIERQGFSIHSAGRESLESFGGLVFKDSAERGAVVNGVEAASIVEAEELTCLRALLSAAPCPVLYLAGTIYFVLSDGQWVSLADNWDSVGVFPRVGGGLRYALLRDGREGVIRRLDDNEVPSGYRD